MTEAVSHWLLPLSMKAIEHENWSMICNVACPALVFMVLNTLNALKLLIEMQTLPDTSSYMR
jgi:hypothetical protein